MACRCRNALASVRCRLPSPSMEAGIPARQGDNTDPHESVLPPSPFQIDIRGCNDSGVDFDKRSPADTLDFVILQKAQQLDLKGTRQFADFIEEESSSFCSFNAPLSLNVSTGERAFFMTEEFTLQKFSGIAPQLMAMNGPFFRGLSR